MNVVALLRRRIAALTFVQAVRTIEQAAHRRPGVQVEVGADLPLAEEPMHFIASDRMALVASDVADIAEARPGSPPQLTANLLGLAGATPALPPFYSETQLQRRRLRDPSFASFLNIFDHRALSFFYRIFRKYSWLVAIEREPSPGQDPISRAVLALAGFATPGSLARLTLDDAVLIPLAGQLGDQRRSAAGVETVLRTLTGLDLRVVEAEPVWLALPPSEQTRLGGPAHRQFARLGGTEAATGLGVLDAALIGAAVLDIQHHYAVEIGPLSHAELLTFCRDDGPSRVVGEACLLAAGMEHQPVIRLSIAAGDVPPLRLGLTAAPALLARTAWLGSPGAPEQVIADCVIPVNRRQVGEGN